MKKSKTKKMINGLLLVVCFIIGITLLVSIVYFCKYTNIFSNMQVNNKIEALINNKDMELNVGIAILKNSTFVIQFVAWVGSLGAIILAIFTFLGIKEKLGFQIFKQEIESEYKKYKEKVSDIDKKISFEFKLTQAKLFYAQKLYSEAWDILSKMSDKGYEVTLYKALTLLKRKDYFDSISAFENALKFSDADHARIYYNMGLCWFKKGQYPKSIDYFDKAIEARSNYSPAYNQKALALRRLGKFNEAIACLTTVISIDSKDDMAYYNLSCYYALTKNAGKAIECLRIAVELNPKENLTLTRSDADFEDLRGKNKDFDDLIGKVDK